MTTLHYCDADQVTGCPGHSWWEKLADCLTDALYGDTADQVTGTVDGFGMHVSLYMCPDEETVTTGEGITVTIPAGTFLLLIEDSQGHVTRLDYDTAEAAQNAFDLWEHQYGLFLDQADMREDVITSSTGRIGA